MLFTGTLYNESLYAVYRDTVYYRSLYAVYRDTVYYRSLYAVYRDTVYYRSLYAVYRDTVVMLLERGICAISRVLVLARNSVYLAHSVEDAIPHVYKMEEHRSRIL